MRKRAEAFAECGTLSQVQTYDKEVSLLERKIGELQSQAAFVNKEEALFKWEKTSYPQFEEVCGGFDLIWFDLIWFDLIDQLINCAHHSQFLFFFLLSDPFIFLQIAEIVAPYKRLFTAAVQWQKAERRFLDGDFKSLNAEAIEAEVK